MFLKFLKIKIIMSRNLEPLPYQRQVVEYLKKEEPEIWAWASSINVQEQHIAEVKASLLKETYRLDSNIYSGPYTLLNQAREALGIKAPATLYQTSEGSMNAALCYLSDEIHIVVTGPILDTLNEEELLAVWGHELSHYLLWSNYSNDFHTADRILNHVCADSGASSSHFETARLYSLFTEIFADRGAALVTKSAGPAISSLVKVQTGMRHVDAESYLRQAKEVNLSTPALSQGNSHPENYLRAEAVDKWWAESSDANDWVHKHFKGPINLSRLDLVAQLELMNLTKSFIATILSSDLIASEHVLLQVKNYFPDWSGKETKLNLVEITTQTLDSSGLQFLCYVMLDLAMADRELQESALTTMAETAIRIGAASEFKAALNDIDFEKREKEKLVRLVSKILKG
jgi:hypothetical protein